MLGNSSKRSCSSPDVNDKPTIYLNHGGGTRRAGNKKRVRICFSFRMLRSSTHSPARLLWRLGAQVARALRRMSMRRRSSRKVSSAILARSRSLADAIDSQRAEAVEDCIEFLNSSSSLQRSNSVSAHSS
ncbi:josephin-like protein-like [Tripterygium wilfordii]|uniref:Josephin-like protein-like n=1 Tax=Tripterygium wilfordii TaxID=458696 RepID=A0A7J7DMQ0_TRIWF|nr:josephin-like protein [Tripterygium wilfordii]KAF5747608.1 josephin-like protein-like [Tripterygium wilfordii]